MTNSDSNNQAGSAVKNTDLDKNFDVFLRAQLQQEKPYLQGDDFTVQVMASLPIAKKVAGWQEHLIIVVPLLVISILVLSQNSLLAFAIRCWVLLTVTSPERLFIMALEISLVALIAVGCWFAKQYRLI